MLLANNVYHFLCLKLSSAEAIEALVMVGIFRGWLPLSPPTEFAGYQNTNIGRPGSGKARDKVRESVLSDNLSTVFNEWPIYQSTPCGTLSSTPFAGLLH